MLKGQNLRIFRDFRSKEDGSSTIEFLFWVPVMVGLMTLTVDAVMLMSQSQSLNNLARDTSRSVAVGAITPSQAEAALADWSSSRNANVTVIEGSDGFVTTTITMPFSSVAHITSVFLDGNLNASSVMWIEGSVPNAS